MTDVNDDQKRTDGADQPISLTNLGAEANLDGEQVSAPPEETVPAPPEEAAPAQQGDSTQGASAGDGAFAANGSTDINQMPSAVELWSSLGDSDRPAGLDNARQAVRAENDFSHGLGNGSHGAVSGRTTAAANADDDIADFNKVSSGNDFSAASAHSNAAADSNADLSASDDFASPMATLSSLKPVEGLGDSTADPVETSVMSPADFADSGSFAGSDTASFDSADFAGGASMDAATDASDKKSAAKKMEKTLRDPLLTRPRKSSVVLDAVFGAVLLVLSGLTWFLAVRTLPGQEFDDLVWTSRGHLNISLLAPITNFFTHSTYDIIIIAAFGVIAFLIAVIRRRWVLLAQMASFAVVCVLGGFAAKKWLPRPDLDTHIANPANSSPSGHSIAAMAASIVLIMAVPLAWRWVASIIGALFSICVGMSVVIGGWHRPSDVVVAFLFVSGVALVTMAFTRNSGMDRPGARHSSPVLQVIETIMITLGVAGTAYGIYLLVQIFPALSYESMWAVKPALGAASVMIVSVALLVTGLVTSLWQVTAAPLSAVGLVGAPPAPPAKGVSRD